MFQEPSPKRAKVEEKPQIHVYLTICAEEHDYYEYYLIPRNEKTKEILEILEKNQPGPFTDEMVDFKEKIEEYECEENVRALIDNVYHLCGFE